MGFMSSGGHGYSNYHSLLANALDRRVEDYMRIWKPDIDDPLHRSWEHIVGERMVLVVLLTTYLEAEINLILSLGVDAKTFMRVERQGLLTKWTRSPKLFIDGYVFQMNSPMGIDLQNLLDRRHAIVHMNPEVSIGGQRIHDGNPFPVSAQDHEMLLRWLSLPKRLVEHVQTQAPPDHRIRSPFLMGIPTLKRINDAA